MKLTTGFLALLAFASTASAQYFSQGWQPGQPVSQDAPAADTPSAQPGASVPPPADGSTPNPQATPAVKSPFDFTRILETGPVSSLLGKVGVNVSKALEDARSKVAAKIWDERIPLITDDNYEELIVREEMTPEEEKKRLWFVIITAQAGQSAAGGVSKFLDESFDSAFNTSLIENDLPDVRWGRIDYFNVTYLTTKWNIWQAPFLVAIRDRGQTMYFYKANNVRLTADMLREFLQKEIWKDSHPWDSSFAPGGKYEHLMHYYALAAQKVYNTMVVIPKWAMMILSGAIASVVMRLLHRDPVPQPQPKSQLAKLEKEKKDDVSATTTTSASTTGTPKKGVKSRKNGKK
ncbi:hypothetical protein K474DRAFT_1657374 [Panus rudis PR-1116 ss-1]|nr:hypothetical protein K474DRAFT_1657374 [Panus rudis PR-1116 ss-1]